MLVFHVGHAREKGEGVDCKGQGEVMRSQVRKAARLGLWSPEAGGRGDGQGTAVISEP